MPRDESIVICITGNGYKTVGSAERPRRDADPHRPIAGRLRGERSGAGGAAI